MSTWNMPPGVSTNDIPGQDDDEAAQILADLAGAVWRLHAKGFISAPDDESWGECNHLRDIAMQAVERARKVLGLDA